MNVPATIPERIVSLEVQAREFAKAREDVEARLRRVERLLWGLVALQLGLKFLL